ncbi:MAG: response regulator transcription factor [Anaerolineae bacterium]|nr:response regulator transcription factor [Anaerolineae bacterium]
MPHILVVDDDSHVLRATTRVLQSAGFSVSAASSGSEALNLIKEQRPDLIVLDIIMPEMDGLEVCRRLRADPFLAKIPILFLTAKSRPTDAAQALDAGGDDFLTKPFEVIELPARARALLRRAPGGPLDPASDYLGSGTLRLHVTQPEVRVGDQAIELTAIEHRLLHYLMLHEGQPISTNELLQAVWEYPRGTGNPKLVHVHILNLRTKIEKQPDNPQFIRNIRGRGYFVNSQQSGEPAKSNGTMAQ